MTKTSWIVIGLLIVCLCGVLYAQTPAGVFRSILISGGTKTVNNPGVRHTATWNNAAVAFSSYDMQIFDTASSTASTFLKFRMGATEFFNVTKNGTIAFGSMTGPISKPEIVPESVGGVSQGIRILKADGVANAFADLAAAPNGTITYCSNCTIASPCAGGGTGAIAKRLNGAWVCN